MTTPVLRGSTAPLPGRPDGTPYGQNTLQATSPDATQIGDLVMAVTWHGTPSASGSALTLRNGEGWVQLANYFHDDVTADAAFGIAVKIATQAGAQVYQAFDDTGGYEWADCRTTLRVYEAGTFDISGILVSTPVSFTDGNVAPNPGAVSGLDAARDYLIEAIAGWWHTADLVNCTPGAPTGYSNLIETAAGGWLELALANKAVSGATSEDPATYTDNVDGTNTAGSVAVTVAILGSLSQRRAIIGHLELEVTEGNLRRAVIGQIEFEAPDPSGSARRAIIGHIEFQAPDYSFPSNLTYMFHPAWARYRYEAGNPVPTTVRRAVISHIELEAPVRERRAIIGHLELEVPSVAGATIFGRTDGRPSPSTESNQSGYINYHNTFEAWCGRQVMACIDYGVGSYADTVTEASSMASLVNPTHVYGWRWWKAQVPGRIFCIQFPCVTNRVSGTNRWQRVANGDFDSYYRTFADNLVAHGMSDIDISLAWEMDGNWYPWQAPPGSVQANFFAAGCRRIIDTMRARQPTAAWSFGITIACANSSVNSVPYLTLVYPGNSYVDWLGLDLYDAGFGSQGYFPTQTQAQKITAYNNEIKAIHLGFLDTWRNFATPRGKQLVLPEWGVATRSDGHGGDDNPNFIQEMANYMTTYPGLFKWHAYYDHIVSSTDRFKISPTTTFPNASQKFLDVF